MKSSPTPVVETGENFDHIIQEVYQPLPLKSNSPNKFTTFISKLLSQYLDMNILHTGQQK